MEHHLPEMTPETLRVALTDYKSTIAHNKKAVENMIESLPKKALERLLKVYSGVQYAQSILDEEVLNLRTKGEEALLKEAIRLQDDCVGYTQLNKELRELEDNGINNFN